MLQQTVISILSGEIAQEGWHHLHTTDFGGVNTGGNKYHWLFAGQISSSGCICGEQAGIL